MKLGILGTGMIVKSVLELIKDLELEEVSILGREASREKTEGLVRQYHLKRAFYDYEELLASDIDTVYVALPNDLHFPFAKKALETGKHVMIEKPITSNGRELEELIAVAKSRGLMIFEAMNVHHLPVFLGLKRDIEKLGNIKIVSFNYSQYSSRYDAFKEGTILPAFDCHKSGGALMDINIYNVHGLVGLFGLPKAARYHANIEKGIDTSGIMVYDYGTFQAVSIGAKDCKAPVCSTIQGDLGAIVMEKPVSQMTEYKILYNDGREELRQFGQEKHRLYYEFAEFIRMVEEKDYERQEELLKLSLDIIKLMTKARMEEGIVFDCD
ncbi:MAG: Gfo/Idh/MocA family oxidoreductase [Hungatella sp.]|nr:Gfo/Idh/MocA family oxidoreductase [Hungatella sp.]